MTLVAVALPLGAGRAVAADSNDSEAAIQRGLQLRKSGDEQGALPEFQRAYAANHTPRAAAQLGLAEYALGRWDDAYQHIAEAVRASDDPWVVKNHAVLVNAMANVNRHVTSVQISGEPEGAEVRVNGRLAGHLPLTEPVRVIAGNVDVDVRADGYRRSTQQISIEASQYRPLVVRLEPLAPAAPGGAATPPPRTLAAAGDEAGAPAATPPAIERRAADRPAAAGPRSGRSVQPVIGWSIAGAGAVVAAIGAFEALAGQSKIDDAVDQAKRANMTMDSMLYAAAASKLSDGESQRRTGRYLLAGGAALAVGGLIVVLTTPRSEVSAAGAAAAQVHPFVGADGSDVRTGLIWRTRW